MDSKTHCIQQSQTWTRLARHNHRYIPRSLCRGCRQH